eukprot:scaffold834_cov244-Pinguiococcus_pyrenoidosus.AAC.30
MVSVRELAQTMERSTESPSESMRALLWDSLLASRWEGRFRRHHRRWGVRLGTASGPAWGRASGPGWDWTMASRWAVLSVTAMDSR